MQFYNLRVVSQDKDGVVKKTPVDTAISGKMVLVRYCEFAPINDIPSPTFWTEFITDQPLLASQGTGILVKECVWRIEWTFPAANAMNLVTQLSKRRSDIGWFFEYNNNVDVPLQDCVVTKM